MTGSGLAYLETVAGLALLSVWENYEKLQQVF